MPQIVADPQAHRIVVVDTAAPSIRVTETAPRVVKAIGGGPRGTQGEQGETGAPGAAGVVRLTSIATAASITPNAGTTDHVRVTAQAGPLTINTPSGTPSDGQRLLMEFEDNGTPRALTFGAGYRVQGDDVLPTTTEPGDVVVVGFLFNAGAGTWDLRASSH